MKVTDRMILTITVVGLSLTVMFGPDCIRSLDDVDRGTVGERYCGLVKVGSVSQTSDVTFITPDSTGQVELVTFTSRNVTVNMTYTVHGQVDMYHGQLEIVVDRLRPADDR